MFTSTCFGKVKKDDIPYVFRPRATTGSHTVAGSNITVRTAWKRTRFLSGRKIHTEYVFM